jgi:predicted ATPase/DNA-binding CsgD family transcriptional regulator
MSDKLRIANSAPGNDQAVDFEESPGAFVLPSARTSLVGRVAEMARIGALLDDPEVRLVTLTGPGGIGKTRLALALARRPQLAGRAGFVSLAEVSDPDLVAVTILRALGLESMPNRPVVEILAASLRGQQALLVLDNHEHLLAGAPVIGTVLERCPDLTVLVTSRVRLGLSGEHVVAIEPLSLPDASVAPSVAEVAEFDAVRLFVDRARAAFADFRLTEANAADVAYVVNHLDGLPLAIELAAARSNHFSPGSLAARMRRRWPLLEGGPRDAPPRQQTMRATVAWSVDQLNAGERELWLRLGICEGGFTVELAEALASGQQAAPVDVLPAIDSLVQTGLLWPSSNSLGEPRFRMPETTRELALELLDEPDEALDAHSEYFRGFCFMVEPGLMSPAAETWFQRVEAEIANIRAALNRALESDDAPLALDVVGALAWFWTKPTYIAEGRAWCDRALAITGDSAPIEARAKVVMLAGELADWHMESEVSQGYLLRALELWREAGNRARIAGTLRALGSVALDLNQLDEADGFLAEAYELAIAESDLWNMAAAANLRGVGYVFRGEHERAIRWHEMAIAAWESIGDQDHVLVALISLSWPRILLGQVAQAGQELQRVLAETPLEESNSELSGAVTAMGWLASRNGLESEGARLISAGRRIRREVGIPFREVTGRWLDDQATALRDSMGDVRFTRATGEGLAMSLEDAVALARTVPGLLDRQQPQLSQREREVLALMVDGVSDVEISERLFISRRTASKHVGAVLEKLGAPNRTAAVTIAYRRGLV